MEKSRGAGGILSNYLGSFIVFGLMGIIAADVGLYKISVSLVLFWISSTIFSIIFIRPATKHHSSSVAVLGLCETQENTKPSSISNLVVDAKNDSVHGVFEAKFEAAASIFSICESEPERLLLKHLIEHFDLIRNNEKELIGQCKINLQYIVGRYRVDFLVDNKLVVEVDGRKYHENRFYEDRLRDQELIEDGYIVIRFPASQVYQDAESCCIRIDNIVSGWGEKERLKPTT